MNFIDLSNEHPHDLVIVREAPVLEVDLSRDEVPQRDLDIEGLGSDLPK